MLRALNILIQYSPQDFGYLRSRWSTEILTIEINKLFHSTLHPGSLRRWLPEAGIVWRRAAPTLHIRDPHKEEKMAAIKGVLEKNCADHPVFYEDEVDIDLNPKIELLWLSLHETIIRNHQSRTMWQLLQNVRQFMKAASPFPCNHNGQTKVER